MRINTLSILIGFLVVVFSFPNARADKPADLRGIAITARDNVTGTNKEVKLYRQMHAVIIGIDKYQNLAPDQQLSYAVKDAKGIERVLQEQYSFDNIYTLYNDKATKNGIMAILQGNLSNIHEDDAVLIFFAGHGTTQKDKLTGGELGYILPYDGTFEKDKLYLNISMTQMRDEIAKVIPARHVFYVIDACYSGTLLAQRAGGANPSHDYAYLKEITKEPVRQVLTAGTDKQTVLDGGPKGHSVFTGRLIEKLEETEDYITAAELGDYVKRRVASDAQSRGHTQTPRDGSFYGLGDFVFVPSANKRALEIEKEKKWLEEELSKLQMQEQQMEAWKIKQQQEEIDRQKKALEARLKIEELRQAQIAEAKRREEERLQQEQEAKRQEEERKKQEEERLAYLKTEISKKRMLLQNQPAGQLTVKEAIERIKKLSSKLSEMQLEVDKMVSEAVEQIRLDYARQLREVNAGHKDEFESTEEYNLRLTASEQKKRRIQEEQARAENDVRTKFSQETAGIEKEIEDLLKSEYPVPVGDISVELGKYDADNNIMPVRVIWKTMEMTMGDDDDRYGTIKIGVEDAIKMKEHKEFIGVKGWANILPSFEPILSNLTIIDEAKGQKTFRIYLEEMTGKNRFVSYSEIIVDLVTGLYWLKDAGSHRMTWDQAVAYVQKLKTGGYSDWRLPSMEEFESLIAFSKSKGFNYLLNKVGFKNLQSSASVGHWSSTIHDYGPDFVWYAQLEKSFMGAYNKHTEEMLYVWPVRSGLR